MKGFGSINELREKAGLKKKPTEKTKYNFTEEELVQIYLDFSRNLWKERKGATALNIKKFS